MNQYNLLLNVAIDNESHTGERIAHIINETLEYWGLAHIDFIFLTTDKAANNVKSIEFLKNKYENIFHVGCFSHALHNLI